MKSLNSKGKKRKSKYEYRGKKKLVILLIVLIAAAGLWLYAGGDSRTGDTKVTAYLPSWNYECYEDVDFDQVTDIYIAFVNPDAEGNLSVDIPDDVLKKIIKKAHRHDVNVLLSLGGGNGTAYYTELTADRKSRKAFNEKIMEYAGEYGFDGVDINIEGEIDSAFWSTYESWVKSLNKVCDSKGLMLTCACASWFDTYISDETFEYFDYISIMAYDNKGAYNHSSYEYAAAQLEYFSSDRGIDKDKLLLGVPFYGYRYANGVCTGDAVTYKEIATYNEDSQYVDESGTCRYNGIETVKKKAQLAKEYGGIMVWSLGQDTNDKYSLLKAINEEL